MTIKTCVICRKRFNAMGSDKTCSPKCSKTLTKKRQRKYSKQYYQKHKEHYKQHHKQFYQKYKEKIKKRVQKYRQKNQKRINKNQNKHNKKVREKLSELIGNKCFFCGTDKGKLYFHEIHGKIHIFTSNYYFEHKKDFRTLCYFCHMGVHWCMEYLGLSWEQITKSIIKLKKERNN